MINFTGFSKAFFLSVALLISLDLLATRTYGQDPVNRPVARLVSGDTYERPRIANERVNTARAGNVSSRRYPSLMEATPIERRAFELTNERRLKNGLSALTWDPELCYLARAHSEKMARQRFFSHVTPEGQRLRDRALSMGIPRFKVIAENIAYNQGFEDPAGFAVERWMISPGHRANMLYIGFQTAAVGVFTSSDGTVYLTQAFIAR